jgi:signal recognition particle subunit SRP19
MRNKKRFYIYPVYFDANRSRCQGRRVKKAVAVQNPSVAELAEVATMLNLEFEMNLEAKYPRFWWIPSGRLQIKKQETVNKNALVKKMGSQLRKLKNKPKLHSKP